MNYRPLTVNMKLWLKELYLREAEEHLSAASNFHLASLGSSDEEAIQLETYADENRTFARVLEEMAKEIDAEHIQLPDGVYTEVFAIKNGVRYNAKIISVKDLLVSFNNGLMDSFDKLISC